MNTKTRLILSWVVAMLLPAGAVLAGNPRASSFSRSSGARSSSQSRPGFQSRSSFQARSGFRNSGSSFQRSNYVWAGNPRISNFSRANTWNRSAISRSGTNWNRFNNGSNRFATNGNVTNRFRGTGFNRGGNWWGNHHHRHHHGDNDFIFFSGFGFPFFSTWDYGYYPSAYYPYYPYTPYYYDPYAYPSYGYSGYPTYDGGYSDGGRYSDGGGYNDPADANSGGYHNGRRYERGGTHDSSVVSRVQEQLAHDGYYKGAIDGVAGSRTYYAIRAYQRDHNLQADGEISDQLLDQMGLR
jgi:hypothetical protein